MISIRQNKRNMFFFTLFVICVSVIINEIICHKFLLPENQLTLTHHIFIGVSGIALSLLFITLLISFLNKKSKLISINNAWENTFNSLSEFVSIHDENFKILKVNDALCELLGKQKEELIGKYCYEVFHHASEPVPNCPHVKSKETGDAISIDIFDDNIGIPLNITCSPFFHKNGKFQGSIHSARPVTSIDLSKDKKTTTKKQKDFTAVCAWCRDVLNKEGHWGNVFDYINENTKIQFKHGICTECKEKVEEIIKQ